MATEKENWVRICRAHLALVMLTCTKCPGAEDKNSLNERAAVNESSLCAYQCAGPAGREVYKLAKGTEGRVDVVITRASEWVCLVDSR